MTPALAIRFAMLVGVLLFGGVVFAVRQSESARTASPEMLAQLAWVARGLWTLAVAGTLLLWLRARGTSGAGRGMSLSIPAWALGEMLALLGGVIWMLTGTSAWYFPGLLFLVLTFVLFPARPGASSRG